MNHACHQEKNAADPSCDNRRGRRTAGKPACTSRPAGRRHPGRRPLGVDPFARRPASDGVGTEHDDRRAQLQRPDHPDGRHSSVAGTALRIHLSNLRSTTPLTLGAVSVATQAGQATAVAGSQRAVTFSHRRSVTIPAGAELVSDPVPMSVEAQQNILVSLYLPHATSSATWHSDAFDTSYLSRRGRPHRRHGRRRLHRGDHLLVLPLRARRVSPHAGGTVVAFGDSITDGYNTPAGSYNRWPDHLARRLAGSRPMGVVDAGSAATAS